MSTTEMTAQNFESLVDKQGIVFVDFWASWCGPCKAFAPVFDQASARHTDVTWAKVDTEAQPQLAGSFEIQAIPTLMVFRDGVVVFERAGALPAATLEKLVQQVKALDMDEVRRKIAQPA